MNGPSGFQEVRSSTPPDHQQIGCWTSNSLNSEKVPGAAHFQLSFPQT